MEKECLRQRKKQNIGGVKVPGIFLEQKGDECGWRVTEKERSEKWYQRSNGGGGRYSRTLAIIRTVLSNFEQEKLILKL